MNPAELAQRAAVVAEAKTWLGTKFHHEARVKGAGVDCLQLLVGVFQNVGLVGKIEIPHYPIDWNLHRDAERYLEGLFRYGHEIPGPPLPGDIAMWRFGRCFSHAAIVVEWPTVIHAHMGANVRLENAEAAAWLMKIGEGDEADRGKPRPRKFLSLWK